ncbi:MAG TPA: amidohydrolase family protein [Acidimicrobiales bacterium]|jgi:predicted TIM-barrel fold metal-dependent hydrolase|nr:amidohydrolase family protein [Acidimicrobiales bacterium]
MSPNLDWLISVDDHVLEPPNLWQERVPAAMRDAAPKQIRDDGGEWWEYLGKRVPTTGLSAMAGKKSQDFSPLPMTYDEMRPGCYDSKARLADMDEAGILASLCFPSFPRFCGQVFMEGHDKVVGLECVKAYNDWMIEEWCGSAPGRFIPLIIVPLWDPKLAAEEVLRAADKGARGIAFSENPPQLGLPSIFDANHYWDPLWSACSEAEVVVCMHIGSSSHNYYPNDESPHVAKMITSAPVGISYAFVEWMLSPAFAKYDNLKIALSEGSIGWMPYYLERVAYVVDRHKDWVTRFVRDAAGRYSAPTADPVLPDLFTYDAKEVFRKHVYGCFIDDAHGMRSIREIGVDNVMIETDYPHSDSTWPNCIEHAHKQLAIADLSDAEKYQILRGNAERVFRFTPAEIPQVS